MSIVSQEVSDELISEFNRAAREKFGDKKGCKKKALVEAIKDWVQVHKKQRRV